MFNVLRFPSTKIKEFREQKVNEEKKIIENKIITVTYGFFFSLEIDSIHCCIDRDREIETGCFIDGRYM